MSQESLQAVTGNMAYKNFVPPITERELGWQVYAAGMPVETCGTEGMRRGWLSAWRAEGYAITSQVWGEASQATA